MSTPVIINPKTGLGQPINPYENKFTGGAYNSGHSEEYWQFEKEHSIPLPVITAAGETLTDGRYECEKCYFYCTMYGNVKFCDKEIHETFLGNPSIKTGLCYQVIETPELPGEETTLDQHIAEMNTLMEVKETVEETLMNASIDYALAQTEDINGKIKKEQTILSCSHDFRSGANWKKEHSIDRDKVIAEIESRIKLGIDYIENQRQMGTLGDGSVSFYKRQNKNLTDLLQVIKQMK